MMQNHYSLYVFFLFGLSINVVSAQNRTQTIYNDPQVRFTITFPPGWTQQQTTRPNEQAYFSYAQNGQIIAEAIIYSYALPHAMEVGQFEAAIFESSIRPNMGKIMPDKSSITVKNFGMNQAMITDFDYAGQNQVPMRMRNYYLVHAYTATGLVLRFGTFKQYWPIMAPKFEEVMASFQIGVSNLTLDQLAQQNLLSVTQPPMLADPKRFMPDLPWATGTPPTQLVEHTLNDLLILKNLAKTDPALRKTLPYIEKAEKEYLARLQAQAQTQAQVPSPVPQSQNLNTNGNTLPPNSALSNILGSPEDTSLTGNIIGEMDQRPVEAPKDQAFVSPDFALWKDPLGRFKMVYPKGYEKVAKGHWYLAFEGPPEEPGDIQFLVLALMDHLAAVEFLQAEMKNRPLIQKYEAALKKGLQRVKAQVTVFQTRNEALEAPNEIITTGILPEEGNLLFMISFTKTKYQNNEAVVKKIIEHFIQNIELKG